MLRKSLPLLALLFVVPSMGYAASGNFALSGDTLHFPDGTSVKTAPKDGKSVLSGSGAPAMIANIGDFYIDTTNNRLYGPYNGSWSSWVSLVGPQGIQGSQGIKGDTGASPWGLSGSNSYYTTGKVGIGTTNPSSTLEVSGDIIRSVSRVYGINSATLNINSSWQNVSSRNITYVKKAADTALRITYNDQKIFLASAISSNYAVLEIVIDGVSCPSGELTNIIVLNSSE